MYEMKDEYLTGIDMIDEEHRTLFEIAEKVYQLQHNSFIPDKYDYINEVLIELKDYALMHFEHEESYMESIHYKKMFTQKIQHQAFREKLAQMYTKLEEEMQEELVKEILVFLTDWLVEHILTNDKAIGEKLAD